MSLATYGVTEAGYRAPRADELLAIVRAAMDSAAGIPLDYAEDTLEGNLTAIVAALVADMSEGAVQTLADALDINNASGQLLENLCLLFGLGRQGATPSQAALTATLSAPTVGVPAGARFTTDPASGTYTVWRLVEDTVLTGAPGETLVVRSEELGQVAAAAGTIVRILDTVPGLVSVTNAAPAALGRLEQTDNELRVARLQLLQAGGRGVLGAVLASATRALPASYFVGAVENTTPATVTVDGRAIGAHGHAVVVYPEPTASEAETLRLAIAQTRPVGSRSSGDHTADVFDPERNALVSVSFYVAGLRAVTVEVTLGALEPGFSAGDVGASVTQAITAYFNTLRVGDDVHLLRLQRELALVPGLLSAGLRLNGGAGFAAADVTVGVFTLATLSGVTLL